MSHLPSTISVIMPVYNEGCLVSEAVDRLSDFLAPRFREWEVILVESGSTDSSAHVCDALAAASPHIRTLHENGRNGFGSALKLGFGCATKDLVMMTTADQPFPLGAIDSALPHLATCDCVLSYRSCDPRKSVYRKCQSMVYNLFVRFLLGVTVRHVNSAFKIYKREFIQSLPLESNGWFIDAEIVYWITKERARWVEIPVELVDRTLGRSTVRISTAWAVFLELWHFWRTRRRNCREIRAAADV